MSEPALTEKESPTSTSSKETSIPQEVVHLPSEEESWKGGVVQQAQQVAGHPFTPEQATPPTKQPIPAGAGNPIQPGINTEQVIEHISDVVGKTGGNVVKTIRGEGGLLIHGETAPGNRFVSNLKEKWRKLIHKK